MQVISGTSYTVPDYPKFDQQKHIYSAATASGDGWLSWRSIMKALEDDKWHAADSAVTDEKAEEILQTPLADWIDQLEVYSTEKDGPDLVATFNLTTWQWEETDETGLHRQGEIL